MEELQQYHEQQVCDLQRQGQRLKAMQGRIRPHSRPSDERPPSYRSQPPASTNMHKR